MARTWWETVTGKEKPKKRHGLDIPGYRDSIYRPEHGSGYVKEIDWEYRTILVIYYDGTRTLYEFEDFRDTYSSSYGGIWEPGF